MAINTEKRLLEKIRIALNKENKTIEQFLNNYNGSK